MILKTALFAALAFSTGSLFADMNMKHHDGKKMMEKMQKELGMTDAQTKEMKALHASQKEANQASCDKMDADIANLKVLINKKASDKELSALIMTIKADHKAMQESMMQDHEAMQKILTPIQQAKMVLHMHEHMKGMKMGMDGMDMKGHDDDKDEDEHEHEDKK